MAKLSKVWIWPGTGKAHKPWDEIEENDSFLKTSRRVSEAFREQLEARDIRCRDSEIEIMLGDVDDLEIAVHATERGITEGPESAEIAVSRDFHHLDEYTRAFFVADALHAITARLGLVHGWDLRQIDAAMDAVRANDYAYGFSSAWKANADGSRRVRLHARLLDDGFGRVRLEFEDVVTSTYTETIETVGGTGRGDFRRMARTLGWSGSSTATLKGLGRGFAASAATGVVRSLAKPKRPMPNAAIVDNDMPLPRIRIDDPPPISFTMGGGPIHKVPKKYVNELDTIFAHLCYDPAWIEWWLSLGVVDVELEYDFEARRVKSPVKLTADRITCTIARPAKTVARGLLGRAMAHADVAVLLDAVTAKTGRNAHPPLPVESESS